MKIKQKGVRRSRPLFAHLVFRGTEVFDYLSVAKNWSASKCRIMREFIEYFIKIKYFWNGNESHDYRIYFVDKLLLSCRKAVMLCCSKKAMSGQEAFRPSALRTQCILTKTSWSKRMAKFYSSSQRILTKSFWSKCILSKVRLVKRPLVHSWLFVYS